jgi:purine-binding chemotaxis protein CheW
MIETDTKHGQELIAFMSGGQEFAFDIQDIVEIRGWSKTTPIPEAPYHVMGMINLRGAILPVINLASLLSLTSSEISERNVVIVAQVGARRVGVLVDAVCETLKSSADQIQPVPKVGNATMTSLVKGYLALENRMISLIDLDHVINGGDGSWQN